MCIFIFSFCMNDNIFLPYPCNMVFVREMTLPDPQESSYGAEMTLTDFWETVR